MGNKICNCYVTKLPFEARMTLRYGAHSHHCPKYRPSNDPVDRQQDNEFRNANESK